MAAARLCSFSARSASSVDASPGLAGLATYKQRWEAPWQRASDGGEDLPMEIEMKERMRVEGILVHKFYETRRKGK